MKLKQKIIGGIALAAIATGAILMNKEPQAIITHGVHWKVVNANSGYWNYPCKAGDTLFLSGKYTYLSFGNVSGSKDSPIVIIGDNAIMSNGFNFSDCNYFHITNVAIKNATGTAISISGKSNHFEVDHINIDTAFYFVWFKTEIQCDSSYNYPMNMDDFYIHDCVFNYCHQDGMYLGSTNQLANRAINCSGKTIFPLPASVSNVRVSRIKITNVQRTAIQLSGARSGTNYIDSCFIQNCGFELNPQQGAGIALGNYTIVKEIAYDTIKNTFLNNFYSYGNGAIKFNHNVCDSADYIYGKTNPQKNASILLSAIKNPTTFKIKNNSIGWNNAGTGIVLYGARGVITDSGNVVYNSGNFTNNSAAQIRTANQ